MIIYQTEHVCMRDGRWVRQSFTSSNRFNKTLQGAKNDCLEELIEMIEESEHWDDSEYYQMENHLEWNNEEISSNLHSNVVPASPAVVAKYCLVDDERWEGFAIFEKKIGP